LLKQLRSSTCPGGRRLNRNHDPAARRVCTLPRDFPFIRAGRASPFFLPRYQPAKTRTTLAPGAPLLHFSPAPCARHRRPAVDDFRSPSAGVENPSSAAQAFSPPSVPVLVSGRPKLGRPASSTRFPRCLSDITLPPWARLVPAPMPLGRLPPGSVRDHETWSNLYPRRPLDGPRPRASRPISSMTVFRGGSRSSPPARNKPDAANPTPPSPRDSIFPESLPSAFLRAPTPISTRPPEKSSWCDLRRRPCSALGFVLATVAVSGRFLPERLRLDGGNPVLPPRSPRCARRCDCSTRTFRSVAPAPSASTARRAVSHIEADQAHPATPRFPSAAAISGARRWPADGLSLALWCLSPAARGALRPTRGSSPFRRSHGVWHLMRRKALAAVCRLRARASSFSPSTVVYVLRDPSSRTETSSSPGAPQVYEHEFPLKKNASARRTTSSAPLANERPEQVR